MNDLADFLLARIEEDEAVATQAATHLLDGGSGHFADTPPEVWEHVRRWRTARVLIESDAKRQIVKAEAGRRTLREDAGDIEVHGWAEDGDFVEVDGERMTTEEFDQRFTEPASPSRTLRLLALPYADHPDYDERWRP